MKNLEIKSLVTNGQLKKGLEESLKIVHGNSSKHNELIILNSRYFDNEKNFELGFISIESFQNEKNKISSSLLNIIDEFFLPKDVISKVETIIKKNIVTLSIDKPFNDFKEEERENLLNAISNLLSIPNTNIQIKGVFKGSVIVWLELNEKPAQRLYWLVKHGALDKYSVSNVDLLKNGLPERPSKIKQDGIKRIYYRISIAAAIVLTTTTLVFSFLSSEKLRREISVLSQEKNELENKLVINSSVQDIIRNENTRAGVMASYIEPGQNFGVIFLNDKKNQMIFQKGSLPPLPDDKVYQVWADLEGQMINLGTIDIYNSEDFYILRYFPGIESLNITIEPVGGSLEPSTTFIGGGNIV